MNILKAIDKLGQAVESALGASDQHTSTTVKISESNLRSLLMIADNDRKLAINAILAGSATNEQKLVVARMVKNSAIDNQIIR